MIGERLEEARKRKGVSIREASEATKIRGDYLLAMEDNTFEIPLPQIYIRGFLKNYARYLKVDPNKILTDYDAHLLGRSAREAAHSSRAKGESLGHVEIPDGDDQQRVVVTEAPEDAGPDPELRFSLDQKPEARTPPAPPTLERKGMRHDQESWNENKSLYMKIGVVFVAILFVSIILIVLVRLLGGKDEAAPATADLATAPATQAVPAAASQARTDSITVAATDNVTLIIEQTLDRKRLWSGTLNSGETLTLEKNGPVSIRFTNGAALVIDKNGQKVRPSQAGVGRTVID